MFPTPKWKENMARLEAINAELLAALEDLAQAIYEPTSDANHANLTRARAAIKRAKIED